jgi:Domain of unknown function (DUF4465)
MLTPRLFSCFRNSLTSLSLALAFSLGGAIRAETVVDFNELVLPINDYFDGYGFNATTGTWTSQGVSFKTKQYGPGWSYSNVNDTSTAGFGNQWAAITGSGFGGSGNYAIGNSISQLNTAIGNVASVLNIPSGLMPQSVYVTNTTFSYLSMRDGDNFAKKFGGPTGSDSDFMKVTFHGFSGPDLMGVETGSIDFFLADYRFSNNALDYLVNQWTFLDLTPLGGASSIGIRFDGSDSSTYMNPDGSFSTYLNHPTYIAIDSLLLSSVPEPTSFVLVGAASLIVLSRRRRR